MKYMYGMCRTFVIDRKIRLVMFDCGLGEVMRIW